MNERHEHDFYRTPEWCSLAVMHDLHYYPTLDPCAGDGALLEAADKHYKSKGFSRHDRGNMRGIELNVPIPRHLVDRITMGDGLKRPWRGERVLMNPPFSSIEKWLAKVPEAEAAVVLMRLGVLAGQKRAKWWQANPPRAIRVLAKRPSFARGGTDSSDYAWVAWGEISRFAEPFGWLMPPKDQVCTSSL